MEFSFVIASLKKIEEDAKNLRLEVEKMANASTAPEDFTTEAPERVGGNRQYSTTAPSDIRDPLAKSMSDLVTPKQLGMIRALSRECGVVPDEECQSVLRCRAEELSKRAASSFIDHLKDLQAKGEQRRAS